MQCKNSQEEQALWTHALTLVIPTPTTKAFLLADILTEFTSHVSIVSIRVAADCAELAVQII